VDARETEGTSELQLRAGICVIMKHELWSGNVGGLSLLTGLLRRAERRNIANEDDLTIIFQRYFQAKPLDCALAESGVRF
jgi:hypothetical protein